jgi:hypothetical protein
MWDAWLKITNEKEETIFDCVHNGCTWFWDWTSGKSKGACANKEELFIEASWVMRSAKSFAAVRGFYAEEFLEWYTEEDEA